MRGLLLTTLLLSTGLCSAKKMQMAIESVILSADLIVIGEIKSDGVGSYVFGIQETLYGDSSLQTVRVQKWKEWTCDSRGFEIRKGQRLVLLLGKGKAGYYPVNDSTGEIPLRQDTVPSGNGFYEVLPHAAHIKEFGEAVRALRMCCHITETNNDFGFFYKWAWECSPEQRSARTSKNELTAWLFERMERREKK